MGGRGSASGLGQGRSSAGISVTRDGDTTQYYFTVKNGQNYYQRGVGGTPEPTPQNMGEKEFRRRIETSGARVENISHAEKIEAENKRLSDRKKADAILDRAYASDREMIRGSRVSRTANRTNRRSQK